MRRALWRLRHGTEIKIIRGEQVRVWSGAGQSASAPPGGIACAFGPQVT